MVASSAATASSNGRKVDRNQDGTLWAWDGTSRFMYSKDNGVTWTVDTSNTFSLSSNVSFFIDQDDYIHLVYKYSGDNFIYYNRGTPNAGRTAWAWSAGLEISAGNASRNYPDLIAHREGTGWAAHIVVGYQSGASNATGYVKVNITFGGVITIGTAITTIGGDYAIAVNTFPSIDFNHTGDGKTIAGSPHLYAAWSAGTTGVGKGIRFRKATYAAGTWTWGTEREIANDVFVNNTPYWLNCLFDGTRVIMGGAPYTGAAVVTRLWERDAADTTTTVLHASGSLTADQRLEGGSLSYYPNGDVQFVGCHGNLICLNLQKYSRSGGAMGAITPIDPLGMGAGWVSMKRGYSSNKLEWVYTQGNNAPYSVKYDRIVASVGDYVPKVML